MAGEINKPKPDTKDYILYDSIFMKFKKSQKYKGKK